MYASHFCRPRIFFLLLLSLLAWRDGSGQSIQLLAEVYEVTYKFPNANDERGGPDPRWEFSGRVSVNGTTYQLAWGSRAVDNHPSARGTFSVDHELIDKTINLPEIGRAFFNLPPPIDILELFEDVTFTLDYRGYEHDFNPDDYEKTGSRSISLNRAAGQWQNETFTLTGGTDLKYTFKMRFKYIIKGAIRSVEFRDIGTNRPISHLGICESSDVRMRAVLEDDAFSVRDEEVGLFYYERREKNSRDSWTLASDRNEDFLDVNVADFETYEYRIALQTIAGRLGSEGDYYNPQNILDEVVDNWLPSISLNDAYRFSYAASCAGDNNGSFTFTGKDLGADVNSRVKLIHPNDEDEDGESAYRPAGEDHLINDLLPETYTLTVTLKKGGGTDCSSDITITIPEYEKPEISSATPSSPACGAQDRGSVRVVADLNGNDEVEYLLVNTGTDGIQARSGFTDATAYQFTNIPSGTYRVELRSDRGCRESNDPPETVTIDPAPTVADGRITGPDGEAEPHIACGNSSIDLKLTPINSGQYFVTLLPAGDGIGDNIPVRDGQTLDYSVSEADTYYFSFTRDDNGCSYTRSIEVTKRENPIELLRHSVNEVSSCTPGSGSFEIVVRSGIAPYVFEIGEEVVTPTSSSGNFYRFDRLTAGGHTVSVTDDQGCSADLTINVGTESTLTAGARFSPLNSCTGARYANVEIFASGGSGSTYQYSTNPRSFSDNPYRNLPKGNHTVYVRDRNRCVAAASITVSETEPLEIVGVSNSPVSCYGEMSELTIQLTGPHSRFFWQRGGDWTDRRYFKYSVDGGTTFNWVDNENWTYDAANEFYVLSIRSLHQDSRIQIRCQSGCRSNIFDYSAADFGVPDPLEVAIDTITDVSCFGGRDGTIALRFSGGRGRYMIQLADYYGDGPNDFDNVPGGFMDGIPRDRNVHVFENLPVARHRGPGRGYHVRISDNRVAGGGTDPDFESCLTILPLGQDNVPTVQQPAQISIGEVVQNEPAECDNSNVEFIIQEVTGGTPPYQYAMERWAGPISNFQATNAVLSGPYPRRVVVQDIMGCKGDKPVSITDRKEVTLNLAFDILRKPTDCFPGVLVATPSYGSPPYTLTLYGITHDERVSVTNVKEGSVEFSLPVAGTYGLELVDSFGCSFIPFTDGFPVAAGEELTAVTTNRTPESCDGSKDGSLTIDVSGRAYRR